MIIKQCLPKNEVMKYLGKEQHLCSAPYNFNIWQPSNANCMLQENATLVHGLQKGYFPAYASLKNKIPSHKT